MSNRSNYLVRPIDIGREDRSRLAYIGECRNGCGYETLPIFNEEGAAITREFNEEKLCTLKGSYGRFQSKKKTSRKRATIAGLKRKVKARS